MPGSFQLAPCVRLEAIAIYSFSDVLTCIETNPEAVSKNFGGRVVLVGSTLPGEDRQRAPDRFLPALPAVADAPAGACSMPPLGMSDPQGGSVPGVVVHVAAIKGALTRNIVRVVPWSARLGMTGGMAALASLLGFLIGPDAVVAALACVLTILFLLGAALIGIGLWLPVAVPAMAAASGTVAAEVVRFLAVDRRRRRVEHAFSHYLAPSIVERLAEDATALRRGGESRDIYVFLAI
jgi:adenylate cyclase